MRKQRRIRKEDIGDPSNFVHVEHLGFGPKMSAIPTQKSFDLTPNQDSSLATEESTSASDTGNNEESYEVERRNKGHRSSLIPRHHRSTTTCIFPTENNFSSSRNKPSIENRRESSDPSISPDNLKSSLKPTFGSLLNLSFLPLGLGKSSSSSSKSPSINKTKRMSLLNLTSGNLFAAPKATYEENKESVHMTGYTRRRSLSNSNDENNDNGTLPPVKPVQNVVADTGNCNPQLKTQGSNAKTSTRIPLAKLGRSKSSMSEFTKRPKLRLKMPPPVPPPKPPVAALVKNISIEVESLPSPPPSPIPSPPPSPVPSTPSFTQDVALRSPKSIPRPRVIPLPSTSSVDSPEPGSPQYLTPAGGSSPLPNNESTFPSLLSPTIPPSSTPFFPQNRNTPGTPPVWPLQPIWPTSISLQSKEATIPEIPSPCKEEEEMETMESEYAPVLSIVDSFISCESSFEQIGDKTDENDLQQNGSENMVHNQQQCLAVTPSNVKSISSVLRENIDYTHWPRIAEKLFSSIGAPSDSDDQSLASCLTTGETDTYRCLLTKTLELWMEKTGDDAILEKLVTILNEENHHQATESLRETLRDMQM